MDAQASPAMSAARISQRAPKSCHRCSTKKMKCTKTIPCEPCLESGIGDQCHREHVITTKHIRQAHRRSRRETLVKVVEQTDPKRTSKDGEQHQHMYVHGRVSVDESIYSEHTDLAYSRSERHAHMKTSQEPSAQYQTAVQSPAMHKQRYRPTTTVAEPDPSYYNEQADIENAANSLELLAWGRQRDSGLSPNSAMVLNINTRNADILLPRQARLVLCYHRDWINWTHNTLNWPRFLKECQDYWLEGFVVEKAWLSIYYAALCVRPSL